MQICFNKQIIKVLKRVIGHIFKLYPLPYACLGHFLTFLNTKIEASSHLLWLNSPVTVRPGRKPRKLVFSQRGSHVEKFVLTFVYHVAGDDV